MVVMLRDVTLDSINAAGLSFEGKSRYLGGYCYIPVSESSAWDVNASV